MSSHPYCFDQRWGCRPFIGRHDQIDRKPMVPAFEIHLESPLFGKIQNLTHLAPRFAATVDIEVTNAERKTLFSRLCDLDPRFLRRGSFCHQARVATTREEKERHTLWNGTQTPPGCPSSSLKFTHIACALVIGFLRKGSTYIMSSTAKTTAHFPDLLSSRPAFPQLNA